MKKNEIASLILTVITNAVRGLRTEEFQIFKKVDTTYSVRSSTLEKVVRGFNPKAKKVKVIIERVYDRSKRDYFTTLTVEIDNYVELFNSTTFISYVLAYI